MIMYKMRVMSVHGEIWLLLWLKAQSITRVNWKRSGLKFKACSELETHRQFTQFRNFHSSLKISHCSSVKGFKTHGALINKDLVGWRDGGVTLGYSMITLQQGGLLFFKSKFPSLSKAVLHSTYWSRASDFMNLQESSNHIRCLTTILAFGNRTMLNYIETQEAQPSDLTAEN